MIIYFQANVRIDGNKATCNVIWLERGLNTICILQQQRKKLCEKGAGIVEKRKGGKPKPSLKIRTANAICWNSLGLFRDYGLNHIVFRNKTFLFFKIEN